MEIQKDVAVLLQPDGVFIQRKASPDWEVGNVVAVNPQRQPKTVLFKRLVAVAACFVLLAAIGFGGYTFLFETTSVISMDINPSVELELNRMGRVLRVTAYNDDGSVLLSGLNLKGKPYAEAVPALLQSEAMQPYLENNVVLEFSVYSQNDEQNLITYLNAQGDSIAADYPQLQVHCNGVGHEVVQQAHEHGISPGKMRALLELQQLDPNIDIEEYSHHSVSEIRRLIQEYHGEETPQGQGNGARNGNSEGNGGGEGNGGTGPHGSGNGGGGGHHG